ncbi:MAG: (2Fe-2S)-binding protein [Rhodospirillales bacterium]|jgi:ferredoxin|nr:(2Fe-2S)-binding protein [Rhodospirillales bacterium]
MPNVTFSAPTLDKDVTVYAVAGDAHTLLALAKKNGVIIPCQCEDGNCGSCLVKITVLGDKPPLAQELTEKEKLTLSVNGKLSKKLLDEAETYRHMPPHRLACQYIVLGEDILVEFSGEPGVEIELRR